MEKKEIMKKLNEIQKQKIVESNTTTKNLPKMSKEEIKKYEEITKEDEKEYENQCKVEAFYILRKERAKLLKMENKLFKEETLLYRALIDDITD